METKKLFSLFLFFIVISHHIGAAHRDRIFNVMKFGASADGQRDDSKAFLEAWKAACGSSGEVKLVIPTGTYLVGPIKFRGPCNDVTSLTFQHQGTLKATTDLNQYTGCDWVEFGWVNGLTLTGGTFDGQGSVSWPFNECSKQKDCKVLPTNILFVNTTNTVVKGITSINSKFFHIGILSSSNFKGSDLKISAPENSPNTDGIHLERSSGVTLSHMTIGTGDDCVSIGQGNTDITVMNVKCGPGHGISVGSLGRYKGEGDVKGVVVKDCTITGTMNGLRIKTWQNSPSPSTATNMTFDNIIMNNVRDPILIDQEYCPYDKCDSSAPSRVKISNIKFTNIRGTSTSPEAVTLRCSEGMPCKDVALQDVSLSYVGGKGGAASTLSTCFNVKPSFNGAQSPPPCQ